MDRKCERVGPVSSRFQVNTWTRLKKFSTTHDQEATAICSWQHVTRQAKINMDSSCPPNSKKKQISNGKKRREAWPAQLPLAPPASPFAEACRLAIARPIAGCRGPRCGSGRKRLHRKRLPCASATVKKRPRSRLLSCWRYHKPSAGRTA